MNNKKLYDSPLVPYEDLGFDEIMDCLSKFKKMVKKHKDCQALCAFNVGLPYDLCYCKIKGDWVLMTTLRVKGRGDTYMSSEGSYDAGGRYKVKRNVKCEYSYYKLYEEDGRLIPCILSGIADGNIARIYQRMYCDLHYEPIWKIGKRYRLFDAAKWGLYKK